MFIISVLHIEKQRLRRVKWRTASHVERGKGGLNARPYTGWGSLLKLVNFSPDDRRIWIPHFTFYR